MRQPSTSHLDQPKITITAAIPFWNRGRSFRIDPLGNCTAFYALSRSTPQVSHAYDAFGRRIWSMFAGDSNGRFTIYDGDLLLGEVQVVGIARLFPLLSPGERIVLDDYHSWSGCRKAADAFFATLPPSQFRLERRHRLHAVKI